MPGKILLSTAYFPPVEYFSLINSASEIYIEKEENYIKQTYRNRCRILTDKGIMNLSVPVLKDPGHKTLIGDVVIDYSKRWQQVHLRAIKAAYGRSPFFQFYIEMFEDIIMKNNKFILDLNSELLSVCLDILRLDKAIRLTECFEPDENRDYDFRYRISPGTDSVFEGKPYLQVFGNNKFSEGLSILDLIFNTGPDSVNYL